MNEVPSTSSAALDSLFRPRSVAVIGASRRRGSFGAEIFHNMLSTGFSGCIYPVNPLAASVQGVRAYPSVCDVPGDVDLAVIVVPKPQVLETVEQCHKKGVQAIIVITAGFRETGEQGKLDEDELTRRVREYGMRMVGPNCMGLLNTDPAYRLNATFAPTWPPPGAVGFSSQSGALGLAILDYARDLGIGIRHFVSVGNKADVSGNDLLEYWENDPDTRVILLYLESLGNPRRFMEIASRVSREKPIVVVKSGRTEAGARAASSHTGALAGADVAVDALLYQCGVIRTDTIEELFDMAMLFANQPIPQGRRVAILTNAGGPAIMASDACESRGLTLPTLSDATRETLHSFLPKEASLRNPVDMIASATPEAYEKALSLLLLDPNVDSVIVLFVPPIVTEANDVAEAIRRGAQNATKPVITCFMGTHGVPPALSSLREGKIPSYAFPEAAAIALSRAVSYGTWQRRPTGKPAALPDALIEQLRSTTLRVQTSEWLEPEHVRNVLQSCGIRTLPSAIATSVEQAAQQAEAIGFPVAIKLVSPTITHKTDVGGVVLGVPDRNGVEQAYRTIEQRLERAGKRAEMSGVQVQAMAPNGIETFIGVTADPAFGRLIAFGLGGVYVEVFRDLVFRINPIKDIDAADMMAQIRGSRVLDGYRGSPAVDKEAIADVLLRISALAERAPEITELDINPLVALPQGMGVMAVDARIRVAPPL